MLDFIRRLPARFDKYKVLAAQMDQYVSVARGDGRNWIVASITNRDERNLNIKLDFLQKGKKYIAYFYEDAKDSHLMNNKEAYKTAERNVKAGDSVAAYLAPGGGHCIYIKMLD